mgnify:CR=1 FL=1
MKIRAEIPEKLRAFWEPGRYKVAFGGRGGMKSWTAARATVTLGMERPMRILCAREIQNSIKDSVHALIKDQIRILGLDYFYTASKTEIRGKNGTLIIFCGLRSNPQKIKSFEGIDIAWVEEATLVTKASWDFLIPTIRKRGSQIWITMNPLLDTDESYVRFVKHPPRNAVLLPVSWRDNPWFSEELRTEMLYLKERDISAWKNVWEGEPRSSLEDAIYANEILAAEENGRICNVPMNPKVPVHTFWDLGYKDNTAIWFVQKIGLEYHIIDFYQSKLQQIQHYIGVLQFKGYVYGNHHLPHDARQSRIEADSVETQLRQVGLPVQIIQRSNPRAGIDMVRAMFHLFLFDKEKTFDGIQAARRYRWGSPTVPIHNDDSHASDGLRTLATAKNVIWGMGGGGLDATHALTEYDPFEGDIRRLSPAYN